MRLTVEYARERKAFGKTLIEMQNTRFKLAEAKTVAHVGRVFIDSCIVALLAGTLDTATASMAKWWTTDMQCKVIDECLQLFGGYGYMRDYPIARMYADARVQKIFGGTNEMVASVDSVLSKPGFGIVSDCAVSGKPLVYAERQNFREYGLLEQGIRRYLRHVHIPADELYAGNLEPWLQRAANAPETQERIPSGGDVVAARRIRSAIWGDETATPQ